MLLCLINLKRFYPKQFDLCAITIDPRFFGKEADYSEIEKICRDNNIEYKIVRSELYNVIFEERKESNPCSLCARMRRGILHDTAKELGCNKIALGHHLNDAAETFLMNLLSEARIGCFQPVTYLSRKDITMIRPLIHLTENDVESAIKRLNLPVIKSKCPANENTRREDVKNLIKQLNEQYEDVPQKIIGAIKRSHIDNW
jgi:tRNA(Ile)-lysidine synthase TilS/MesJ